METINNELMTWLHQLGVGGVYALWILRVGVVLIFLLSVYVIDKMCR